MLLLTNTDVARILTMQDCIEARAGLIREMSDGDAVGSGRSDVYTPSDHPDAPFHRIATMTGSARRRGYACTRVMSDMVSWPSVGGIRREEKWAVRPGRWCGLLFLYSTHDGEPLAIIHDGIAQHYRVGAGAGIGAQIMARAESETVGIIGSGGMAQSYLEALVETMPIRRARVFSPDPQHRETFATTMAAKLDIEVLATTSPEAAVRGADIVALCASAVAPVFEASWLTAGMHVTDVTRASTPRGFSRTVDVVAWNGNQTPIIDPLPATAMYARGGILSWVAGGPAARSSIPSVPHDPDQLAMPTLADVVAGRARGRKAPEETSFFHNVGASAEGFAAIAATIYESARAAGVGREIPTEWFIEDVRD